MDNKLNNIRKKIENMSEEEVYNIFIKPREEAYQKSIEFLNSDRAIRALYFISEIERETSFDGYDDEWEHKPYSPEEFEMFSVLYSTKKITKEEKKLFTPDTDNSYFLSDILAFKLNNNYFIMSEYSGQGTFNAIETITGEELEKLKENEHLIFTFQELVEDLINE